MDVYPLEFFPFPFMAWLNRMIGHLIVIIIIIYLIIYYYFRIFIKIQVHDLPLLRLTTVAWLSIYLCALVCTALRTVKTEFIIFQFNHIFFNYPFLVVAFNIFFHSKFAFAFGATAGCYNEIRETGFDCAIRLNDKDLCWRAIGRPKVQVGTNVFTSPLHVELQVTALLFNGHLTLFDLHWLIDCQL